MAGATVVLLVCFYGMFYVNYIYQTYIIGAFQKYPEEVAKPLRKALYYTNYDVQPEEALKYYKQAVLTAEEMGMDRFGDEYMGIKIQLAAFLEKLHHPSQAIAVLERIRLDNMMFLDKYGDMERHKIKRTAVLAKTIALNVKLGELYADPLVWDRDTAEERLVWAVETSLKELQRRQAIGAKEEDEGPWMTGDAMGAALESLAHVYEAKNQHYLSTPLFLRALSLYPTTDCHSVVLMNNLASSIAQQSPRAARAAQTYATSQNIDERPVGPVATRETMIQNARVWAQKALDVAATIKPPTRNEECDIGCAVALHNLGEFAEMVQDFASAKKSYREAVSLARAVGFEEGIENSSARLRQLSKK